MPLCLRLRQVLPDFGRMPVRDLVLQEVSRYVARHEISWAGDDDSVSVVLQHVDQMALERFEIPATMEADERGLVEAHSSAGSEDLGRRDPRQGIDRVAAGALDTFEILEAAEMDIAHKYDDATFTGVVCRRHPRQLLGLISVAHGENLCRRPDQATDDIDYGAETGHHLGGADERRAVPCQVTRVARPRADTDDHDPLRLQMVY